MRLGLFLCRNRGRKELGILGKFCVNQTWEYRHRKKLGALFLVQKK